MSVDSGVIQAQSSKQLLRRFKRPLKRIVPLLLAIYFIPVLLAVYAVLGLLDFCRNSDKSLVAFDRYFAGNGTCTWILSPFNLLMDVFTIPFWNKGIYQLEDLPQSCQDEVNELIASVHSNDLVGQLSTKMGENQRGMLFFKWYGKNVDSSVDIPEFHRKYKHIRTIGVSVFNKKQTTGRHFGPLRVTLRLLYNINPIDSDSVYIKVGNHTNYWRENQLFIFDDTLEHQSVNGSDAVRYCMFVDILRPSLMPRVMDAILACVRVITFRFNSAFYNKWTFIK